MRNDLNANIPCQLLASATWRRSCVVWFGLSIAILAKAQTPQTVDQWNEQAAVANAEKAAIQAQADLIAARKAREDALHPDVAKAAQNAAVLSANAQKALADAETASSNAAKAKADASSAALKSQIGEVPTSGYNGAVDLKDKAGSTEAALLAARAIDEAASQILRRKSVIEGVNGKEVWVFALSDLPTFNSLLVYKTYSLTIDKALDDADENAKHSLQEAGVKEQASASFAPAALGLGLDAANKLLSFFKTDYAIGGIDVSYDDTILVHAISGRLLHQQEADSTQPNTSAKATRVQIPSLYNQAALTDSGQEIFRKLTSWAQRVATVQDRILLLQDQMTDLTTQAAKKSEPEKQKLLDQSKACADAAASLTKGKGTYDTIIFKLTSADDKGVVPLASTVRESTIFDLLNRSDKPGIVLLVKVQKAGGAYYTKKNLWTIFGGMPLWHMGGTVVSYVLLGGSGNVLDAGLIPLHGGFIKAKKLQQTLTNPPK